MYSKAFFIFAVVCMVSIAIYGIVQFFKGKKEIDLDADAVADVFDLD
jgi:hypothetical protein